jgi:NAD(P)H dehydrogenase (quinone)
MSQTNILIAFYSRNGSTEALANAIAHGAREAGADVRLRRARDIVTQEIIDSVPEWGANRARMDSAYAAPTPQDAEWADGIIFGTPSRFGTVCAELKAYIDSLGGLWAKGALNGKAGAAFSSTSTPHGGNEMVITSLFPVLSHLGLIVVPTGYADAALFKAGTPYGATTVSGMTSDPPTADDLKVAVFQGKRVTAVAKALKLADVSGSAALKATTQ